MHMNKSTGHLSKGFWIAALMLGALSSGCGGGDGGRDGILGTGGLGPLPPTVTAVLPLAGATAVSVNLKAVTATFSEAMAPLGGTATFTVTCAAPCVSPTGAVGLDATSRIAAYTFTPGTTLVPLTSYTATVTGARSLASGLALIAPYTWVFSTGVAPPTVTAVVPVNNALGVPTNLKAVTAEFSEAMSAFGGSATFVVTCAAPCTSPTGTVTLNASNRIASLTFTASTTLATLTTYTATVTGAKSLASGLAIAQPYVWVFTTGAAPTFTRPMVLLTSPATTIPGPTTGSPATSAISAVFNKDMDPATLNTATFTLSCAAPCVAPSGQVAYGAGSRTAVFVPAAALAVGVTYTARIPALVLV